VLRCISVRDEESKVEAEGNPERKKDISSGTPGGI
jgi:hypothetical protein